MKKILSFAAVAIAAMTITGTAAQAEDNKMYVSGSVGVNWMNDMEGNVSGIYDGPGYAGTFNEAFTQSMKTGLALAGAVGCEMNDFRLEGELSYRTNKMKGIDGAKFPSDEHGYVGVLALMSNVYYDIAKGAGFEPYVMAGCGVANVHNHITIDSANYTADQMAFAYQLGAGFAMPVSDGVKFDLGYRYFATSHMTNTMGTDYAYDDTEAGLGDARYNSNMSNNTIQLGLRVNI